MKQGYEKTESDLFVARAQLELISRSENHQLAKSLRKNYYQQLQSPLLNFVDMLPEVIEMKDFAIFQMLLKKYDLHIKRDPAMIHVLDRIA